MAPPVISLRDVSLDLGEKKLFAGIDLAISAQDRLCLVGRNGTGKSTLLKMLSGDREPDQGERTVQAGIRIAYLAQDPDFSRFKTVFDVVADALPAGEADAAYRVEHVLADLNLKRQCSPATLSGGESRRLALARSLVGEPDILLLDEPTNHLDLPTIEWLEARLTAFKGAFVIVSHDRRFLADLTRATLWLDRGVLRRNDKGFEDFERWSAELIAQEDVERAKLDKTIAQETVWSHQGITARRKRNQGRLRRLQAMRAERARQIKLAGPAKLTAETGGTSGRIVVDAENLSKAFGETVIVRNFSTRIARGDRIGIIGPNGAGKTTLLRMLTGDLKPDGGTVRLGTNLEPVYIDQRRARLDDSATLWETLCEGGGDQLIVNGRPRHVVSYLKDFLFDEGQARSPVSSLSGGERNRLMLARYLSKPSNFLILDEPTNDLDMDTLDLLQDVLSDYDGTVLIISHDRDFLDRLVTSTIALEGDGRAIEYAGGYADVERQRKAVAETNKPQKNKNKEIPAAVKGEATPARTKLSYKQQRALEQLPDVMENLQNEISQIQETLAKPGLFESDPERFRSLAARLADAEAELTASEEQWLELEMLREQIESARNGGRG